MEIFNVLDMNNFFIKCDYNLYYCLNMLLSYCAVFSYDLKKTFLIITAYVHLFTCIFLLNTN